ncbi:hypothetical protein ACFL3V_00485 [Nanoarchaeota archaeon]
MPRKKVSAGKRITSSILSDIRTSNLFNLVSTSFKSWYTNWPQVLLSILTDLLFVIATSTVITLIQFTLFEHLEALMKMTGEATGGLMNIYNQTSTVTAGMNTVTQSADFAYHLNVIFKYLGVLILCSFLFWIIFQGLSWYIAYRMATEKKKRLPFLVFWKNFALESLPFYFLSIFWIFISVRITLAMKMSIAPIIGEGTINFLFIFFILVTWYFGVLCYTLTSRYAFQNFKQGFIYGTKRFTKTLKSFAFIAVLFVIIDLFLRLPFIRGDPFLLMVFGTLIFVPALVFSRILMYRTAQEYWERKAAPAAKKK